MLLRNENALHVEYRIDGEFLYRYHTKIAERMIPWGPEAGAWRLTGGQWQPVVPEIDLPSVEQTAVRPGASRLPSWRARVAACRFLIERWPEEARDAVRRFPSGHCRLLEFLNRGETPALELLRSNPALGYLAAISGEAGLAGLRRRALAARFGFPETEHAVRLLAKAPAAWISSDFLEQLRAVSAREPDADNTLIHLARINPIALEVARDPELRATVAPECVVRLSRVLAPPSNCDLIARLRDLQDDARARELPPPRIRRLADLDRSEPEPAPEPEPEPARKRSSSAFPAPPLPDLTAPGLQIHAIRTRQELVAESATMHHCAGTEKSYMRRVAAGRLYFYRMLEPERLTIAVRPGGSRWTVEEVRGVCNRLPGEQSIWLIWNWLKEFGCAEPAPAFAPPRHAAQPPAVPARRRRYVDANQLSFHALRF